MRKKLSAGVLLVLGSLGALQVQAQTVTSVPVLEQLGFSESTARKIVALEQELRDLRMLAIELEQLQLAIKNAKRASPEIWDSSQNLFDNITNAIDQTDTLLNVSRTTAAALKRAGCADGLLQGARGKIDGTSPVAADATPKEAVAARERNQLQGRCIRLAEMLTAKEAIREEAVSASTNAAGETTDDTAGPTEILDKVLAELQKTNAQALQARLDAQNKQRAEFDREVAAEEAQKAMHDRLMKAPSSSKKVDARNPTLTVDPNNY